MGNQEDRVVNTWLAVDQAPLKDMTLFQEIGVVFARITHVWVVANT